MRSVYPYTFTIEETTPASALNVGIAGKSFQRVLNIYLSGSSESMFLSASLFNPFSANNTNYPPFSAVKVNEFTIEADKIITLAFPEVPQTQGFVDIIVENEAGYGKLTTDTRMPFISSFQGAVDIQNPWVHGLIIIKNS